jgi:uncharacterized membrane protein YdjX (TVP38/TMEM64 family)
MSARRPFPWRWIAAAALVAALFVVWRLLPLTQWIQAFQSWASDLGPAGGLLYALVYVVAALLFVPGSLLTIGAGFTFGLLWGTLTVMVASVTAAALAFLIARYLARSQVEKLVQRNPNFRAIDRAISQKGWKVVLLLRLSPLIPFNLSNYLFGLTDIRFGHFVLASWVGMFPGTLLYVWLGAAGQGLGQMRRRSVWEWVFLAVGLVATAAVTVLLTRVAKAELQKSGVQQGK